MLLPARRLGRRAEQQWPGTGLCVSSSCREDLRPGTPPSLGRGRAQTKQNSKPAKGEAREAQSLASRGTPTQHPGPAFPVGLYFQESERSRTVLRAHTVGHSVLGGSSERPPTSDTREVLPFPHITVEETEAQRGRRTCPSCPDVSEELGGSRTVHDVGVGHLTGRDVCYDVCFCPCARDASLVTNTSESPLLHLLLNQAILRGEGDALGWGGSWGGGPGGGGIPGEPSEEAGTG